MDHVGDIIENIHDVLVDAKVEEPAGRGAGYAVIFDENFMRVVLERFLPPGFVWINKPVTVTGEDFTYEATCLCSFPKTSGKVRYIVEDHGRIFVQRAEQLKFPIEPVNYPEDKGEVGGCPHCGYRHPPDGMCI